MREGMWEDEPVVTVGNLSCAPKNWKTGTECQGIVACKICAEVRRCGVRRVNCEEQYPYIPFWWNDKGSISLLLTFVSLQTGNGGAFPKPPCLHLGVHHRRLR
jgi:hypothetical protein